MISYTKHFQRRDSVQFGNILATATLKSEAYTRVEMNTFPLPLVFIDQASQKKNLLFNFLILYENET